MLYIIGIIPILSRFLQNKLDFFMVITLIIAKVLRFQPVGIPVKLVAVAI
jgi:hypothetical protein